MAADALHAGAYAIQSRLDGAAQTVNQVAGMHLRANWLSEPEHTEFGSARWHAQRVGEGIGGAVPYFAATLGVSKAVSLIGGRLLTPVETLSAVRRMDTLAGSFTVGAGTGFVYDALTAPIREGQGDFWHERFKSGVIGAATMGTASAGWTKYAGRYASLHSPEIGAVLRNPLATATTSGALAGLVNAEGTALMQGRHADLTELGTSAYTFAFLGGTLAGLNHAIAPRHLTKARESAETETNGSALQRLEEARRLQSEINRCGDQPSSVLAGLLAKPSTRVLALGEAHNAASPLRNEVQALLPSLRGQNVVLAQELPSWMQPHIDQFARTGSFDLSRVADPAQRQSLENLSKTGQIMEDFRQARAAGVPVRAIDHPTLLREERGWKNSERDSYQANELQSILQSDPTTKVIWIGGADHVVNAPGSALSNLRAAVPGSSDAIVSVHALTNNGMPYNLNPVTRALNNPIAFPVRENGPIAGMDWLPAIRPDVKLGQFDYLAMYPKRLPSRDADMFDLILGHAGNDEFNGQLQHARTGLYGAWDMAQFRNSPTDKMLAALQLARVERKLGNNERADKFIDEALRANQLDIEPEDPALLRLLAEPRNGPAKLKTEQEMIYSDDDPRLEYVYKAPDKAIEEHARALQRQRLVTQFLPWQGLSTTDDIKPNRNQGR